MLDFEPIPYRIRIGVTGHRKLDDPAAIQAAVRRAIDTEIEESVSGGVEAEDRARPACGNDCDFVPRPESAG